MPYNCCPVITQFYREIKYEARSADEYEFDEVKSYEEVTLMPPSVDLYRPVVLIGPPGIGRNELKRRLILFDSKKFATTIPTTSRPQRPGETEGVEYYFRSRLQMEKLIRERRFNIMDQHRTCILNPHPQAVRALRTPELKPYFIFVKPPPYPTLEATRSCAEVRSTFDSDYSRGFTSSELLQMIETGNRLEATFGHFFDYVLINGNLEFAFRELVEAISSMQTQPCWVPKDWVSS
ncbi:unnamed protein product [Soboliphyme baturini]|uniref:Guanylate kinase-like domain-containing protein n=1 Tax=Soboliphyme baturini TaxID=241478 RepID=A0A183IWR0_9BILA|nr:unnamed protein product [Soboliphyme baturini]